MAEDAEAGEMAEAAEDYENSGELEAEEIEETEEFNSLKNLIKWLLVAVFLESIIPFTWEMESAGLLHFLSYSASFRSMTFFSSFVSCASVLPSIKLPNEQI